MNLTRPEMHLAAVGLLGRLVARQQEGPAESALDAFIPELQVVGAALDEHVEGKVVEDAKRRASLVKLDKADDQVDTWLRHVESYLRIEGGRRTGAHAADALALHQAAFRDGIAHVDDYIPQENQTCRDAIAILRTPEHAATLAAIALPMGWIDQWETGVDASDAAFTEVQQAREAKSTHVDGGKDAEADFVDITVRLRRYVASRASRKDKAKIAEGRALLEPLLAALEKADKERAARETRKKKPAKPKPAKGQASSAQPAQASSAQPAQASSAQPQASSAQPAQASSAQPQASSAQPAQTQQTPAQPATPPPQG